VRSQEKQGGEVRKNGKKEGGRTQKPRRSRFLQLNPEQLPPKETTVRRRKQREKKETQQGKLSRPWTIYEKKDHWGPQGKAGPFVDAPQLIAGEEKRTTAGHPCSHSNQQKRKKTELQTGGGEGSLGVPTAFHTEKKRALWGKKRKPRYWPPGLPRKKVFAQEKRTVQARAPAPEKKGKGEMGGGGKVGAQVGGGGSLERTTGIKKRAQLPRRRFQ